MKLIINSFKTAIRERAGCKEPVFPEVDMSCRIEDNAYIVDVFNVTPEKLAELKQNYQWLEEKEIDLPDPEEMPNV
jgi:hypothetical protein